MFGKDKSIEKQYHLLIAQYTSSAQRFLKISRALGLTRFLIFLALLYCLYLFLRSRGEPVFLLWSGLCLIIFLVLIRIHLRTKAKKDLADSLLWVNKNELCTYNGADSELNDGRHVGADLTKEDDLDLFGPRSLFHLLNRCSTYSGIRCLGESLIKPPLDIALIKERQSAVRELSHNISLRQEVLAQGLLLDDLSRPDSLQKDFNWPGVPNFFSLGWNILLIAWPIIMIGLSVHFCLTLNAYPLITALLLGLGISGTQLKHTQKGSQLVSGKSKLWSRYAVLFQVIQESDLENSLLNDIKAEISEAYFSVRNLARLSSAYDQRLNLLVFIFLNAYFLYDVHLNRRLSKWIGRHQPFLAGWIEQLGFFESMASLATFHFNYPGYSFPVLTDQRIMHCEELGHPLIQEEKRVHNHIRFGPEKHLFIITGSNMSGKSTFLRTIGLNQILAMLGGPVCARSMKIKPLPIYSSIRISDSLQEETSYFYAELKKLKEILFNLDNESSGLVLLDEVLKGTNSEDKLYGAKKLIEKLVHQDALIFLATHILPLSDLAEGYPSSIENYCFESTIEQGTLHFDYKLRKGVAQHRNATFLMEQMGII